MTPKQQRFVDEYLIDLNATQAATRAGYSKATANEQGARLLANVSIAQAIENAIEVRAQRTAVTADKVLQELAKIGFSDIRKMFTAAGSIVRIEDLDDEAAACLSAIEVVRRRVPGSDREEPEYEDVTKIKLWDKRAALVDMGRHLGMFTDNVKLDAGEGLKQFLDRIDGRSRPLV